MDICPITPSIGAEVLGVDLAEAASDDGTIAVIEKAWIEHKVLVFRDQAHLTTKQHLDVCRRLGDLETHPFAPPKPGYPEVLMIIANEQRRGNENTWHSDVTWRTEPSRGSMLRAIEVPEVGGDTLFADMEAAYDGLAPELQDRLAGLSASHDLAAVAETIIGADAAEGLRTTFPPSEHPVVRTHPQTGRRSIYVNAAFTTHIVGVDPAESEKLLQHLYAQATVPEYQFRLRWRPGTVALWDNRCVQHYAVSDYWPSTRLMERVTIVGDRPR
jgi:taurine dioxygenase